MCVSFRVHDSLNRYFYNFLKRYEKRGDKDEERGGRGRRRGREEGKRKKKAMNTFAVVLDLLS